MGPESHRCQNTESRFGHEIAVSRVTGVTSCRPAANEKVPDRDTWTMSRPGTAEPPVGIEPTTYSFRGSDAVVVLSDGSALVLGAVHPVAGRSGRPGRRTDSVRTALFPCEQEVQQVAPPLLIRQQPAAESTRTPGPVVRREIPASLPSPSRGQAQPVSHGSGPSCVHGSPQRDYCQRTPRLVACATGLRSKPNPDCSLGPENTWWARPLDGTGPTRERTNDEDHLPRDACAYRWCHGVALERKHQRHSRSEPGRGRCRSRARRASAARRRSARPQSLARPRRRSRRPS